MRLGLLAPQIVLLVGAALVLVTAMVAPARRQGLAPVVALAALVACVVSQLRLLGGADQLAMEGLWALDAVTGVATVVICAVTGVAVLLAPEWLATDARRGEYHALLLLGALGAMAMVAAADLNQLVVAVTLSSVTGYVLAAYHRRSPLAVEAGMSYFLIGGLANVVLLLGVVLAFAGAGTTSYAGFTTRLAGADAWVLVPAAVALTVGLALEVGAVPAHAWVPDVAQGAPVPSAAFLTVVPKIGGTVALARLVEQLPGGSGLTAAVAAVAAVTMTLGNLSALSQDDVRRLLGWSSVSQAGYALVAVAAVGRSPQALPALLLFLATYAAGNTAAFAVVAVLRGRTRLDDWHGLARTRPLAAWTMTVALLSLVGIPPLAGFAGKLGIFTAAVDADLAWLAWLVVANTVVSLAYYLRVVATMHLRAAAPGGTVHLLGRWAVVGTGLAATATIVLGVLGHVVAGPVDGRALLP